MAFMLCGSSKSHHVSMDIICDVKPTTNANIPDVNQDVEGMEAFMFRIPRGRKGFGFTITGSSPVRVGQVKEGTPAADVGLCKDDSIARINGQNVSRSIADSVAKLIRNCATVLELVVYREYDPPNACSTPVPCQDENMPPISHRPSKTSHYNYNSYNDENLPPKSHQNFGNRLPKVLQHQNSENIPPRPPKFPRQDENRVPLHNTQLCSIHNSDYIPMRGGAQKNKMAPPLGLPVHENSQQTSSSSSSSHRRLHRMSQALPPLMLSYQSLTSQEQERQSAVATLRTSHEKLFNQLNFGVHSYFAPLQNSIISPADHKTLFQNIDQITSTLESLLHQYSEHSIRFSDHPDHDFLDAVGALYHPVLPDLCHAMETYCAGAKSAIRLLQELRKDPEFSEFLKRQNPLRDGEITIGTFLQKPIEWMKDSVVHLQAVFSHTSSTHHDYEALRTVIEGLRHTCSAMTQHHTKRCASTFSLISTSSQLSLLSQRTGHSMFVDSDCTLETIKDNSDSLSDHSVHSVHSRNSGRSSQSELSKHSGQSGQSHRSECSHHSQNSHNSHHSHQSQHSKHSQDSGISHSHLSKHSSVSQSNPPTHLVSQSHPAIHFSNGQSNRATQSDCGYVSPMDQSEEATQSRHSPHCGYSQYMLKRCESVVSGTTILSEHLPSSLQSSTEIEVAAIDSEVLDIQNRLLFAGNVKSFKIATATRHMIYAGELFFMDSQGSWSKVYVVLLSDLLLVTRVERDNYLTVLEEPIVLQDITAINWTASHATEFQIAIACGDCAGTRDEHGCRTTFTLRSMTLEQKHTWQSIIEQRIEACRTQQQRDDQLGRVIGHFI